MIRFRLYCFFYSLRLHQVWHHLRSLVRALVLVPVLFISTLNFSFLALAQQQTVHLSESPCMISFGEVNRLYRNDNNAVLIDVRSSKQYARLHINNSLNIPAYNIKSKRYLRDKHIVLIDQGHNQLATVKACAALKVVGFLHIKVLTQGLHSWVYRGGEVVGNAAERNRVSYVDTQDLVSEVDRANYWVLNMSTKGQDYLEQKFQHVRSVTDRKTLKQSVTETLTEMSQTAPTARLLIVDVGEDEYPGVINLLRHGKTGDEETANVVYLAGGLEAYKSDFRNAKLAINKPGFNLQGLRNCLN